MSETTTVRVGRATRDHLHRISTQSGQTFDATIQRGLDLIDLEARRKQAEIEAREIADDPEDRAEVQAAIQEALGC